MRGNKSIFLRTRCTTISLSADHQNNSKDSGSFEGVTVDVPNWMAKL